ncbi:9105_t:CDS:1 [Ambispora gerdemannii]|uniref:9105_t:CDS:1 n=1 Tax=Ambispora gerdemannii TaxID=144530 RepID=A0A9N9C2J7_9GLOM|nr:9105_t:CDS:1 [Ambispora gerdemannii]
MNDEERNVIINSGLKLKKAYPQPLFLYTSFIKNFNWDNLIHVHVIVIGWYRYTRNGSADPVARDDSIWQNTYQNSNNINQNPIDLQFLTQTYKLTSSFRTPFILAKLKKVKLSLDCDKYGDDGYEVSKNNIENMRDLINALKLLNRNIRILEINTNVLGLSNIHQLCDLLKFRGSYFRKYWR